MTSIEASRYIGFCVAITWKDPCELKQQISSAYRGKEGLATWIEWGIVDDVHEDVLRFKHGEASSPGQVEPDEADYGYIPVCLIEEIVVMRSGLPDKEDDDEEDADVL